MSITSVNQTGYPAYTAAAVTRDRDMVTAQAAGGGSQTRTNTDGDRYVPSDQAMEEAGLITYCRPKKLTAEQVDALKQQVYESMKSLAYQMIRGQMGGEEDSGLDINGMSFEELAASLGVGTTPETAAAAIAEDGMWGVDAVATRLMDMAMALSNSDPSKAALLRDAVQKGFEAVGDIDSLPQVCQDTYAETMARFDYWEANGSLEGYGETDAE